MCNLHSMPIYLLGISMCSRTALLMHLLPLRHIRWHHLRSTLADVIGLTLNAGYEQQKEIVVGMFFSAGKRQGRSWNMSIAPFCSIAWNASMTPCRNWLNLTCNEDVKSTVCVLRCTLYTLMLKSMMCQLISWKERASVQPVVAVIVVCSTWLMFKSSADDWVSLVLMTIADVFNPRFTELSSMISGHPVQHGF